MTRKKHSPESPLRPARKCGDPLPAVLHNHHLGRFELTSVRGELVWLFIPYATTDHEARHG